LENRSTFAKKIVNKRQETYFGDTVYAYMWNEVSDNRLRLINNDRHRTDRRRLQSLASQKHSAISDDQEVIYVLLLAGLRYAMPL